MPLIDKPLSELRVYTGINPRPADFDAYWAAQMKIDELWRNKSAWWRASALNTARMGWFSSDRTIREYASEIWKAPYKDIV